MVVITTPPLVHLNMDVVHGVVIFLGVDTNINILILTNVVAYLVIVQ